MRSIRLSEKHGVNPSLLICYFCCGDKGLALCGRMPGDVAAPRKQCVDKIPCDDCKLIMAQGVILISVRDGSDPEDPYRTGGWIAMKDEAILRCFPPEYAATLLKCRAGFLEDSTWKHLGLPEYGQPIEGVPNSIEAFKAEHAKGTHAGNDHPAAPEASA